MQRIFKVKLYKKTSPDSLSEPRCVLVVSKVKTMDEANQVCKLLNVALGNKMDGEVNFTVENKFGFFAMWE